MVYTKAKSMFINKAFDISKFMDQIKLINELKPHIKKIAQESRFLLNNPTAFRISMLEPYEQISAIEDYIEIFSSKFGMVNIQIFNSESSNLIDPSGKAKKARPMKPAIYIE